VIKILDVCPKFALQNQKDLFKRKIDVIMKESGKDEIYMRNFIRRHPDIVMKSLASLETKVHFF